MLRVLVVSNLYPPHAMGGYELSCRDVVERFRRRGHVVDVLTTTTRLPGVADDPQDGVRRQLPWFWDDHKIHRPGWREALVVERETAATLRRTIDETQPDVISVWNLGAMSMRVVAEVAHSRRPAVYVVCDDWLDYGPRLDGWRRRLRWLGLRRVPDPGPEARWVFVSSRTRRQAETATGRTFAGAEVIGSGVDVDDFPVRAPAPREWRWRLLYVGRLDPRKGVDVAIETLARLPEEATLRVVGTGDDDYVAGLHALAQRLGVADRVTFAAVPREQVAAEYAAADALVFPPVWDEPFGLVPLEAMACATPVVATPSGGSADFLGEVNAILFPAGDADAAVGRRTPARVRRAAPARADDGRPHHGEAAHGRAVRRPARGRAPRRRRAERAVTAVLHYHHGWLPLSEQFVHAQISHSRHRGVVVSRDRATNRAAFPFSPVLSLQPALSAVPARWQHRAVTGALRGVVRRYRPAVVHVHFGYRVHDVLGLVDRTKLPLVLSLWGHDATGFLRDHPDHYAGVFGRVDRVLVPSRWFADLVTSIGADPASVVISPAGVDTEFFSLTPLPSGPPTVVFVGRFVEKKGLDVLAAAWSEVRAAVPGARLRALGSGPLEGLLRGLPDVTVVVPDAARRAEQVREVIRSGHVVTSPSRTGADGDAETMLIVNVEAQASGRPVVTTDHAAVPEFVRDGESATVVPAGDPAALAAALVDVLTRPELATRMAAAGPVVAAAWDIRTTAAKVDAVYDELAR